MKIGATTTVLLVLSLGAGLACSEGGKATSPAPAKPAPQTGSTPPSKPPPPAPEPADLVADGRQAYLSNCIACHNPDPKLDGALGPAVAGSSRALLEARILRAEYPEGYKPKRETAAMIAMPFLERQIPAIAAYLDAEG